MSKSTDHRFEKELLQALRDPLRASERDAARTRVSKRLEASLLLEVGTGAALPLLLEAPPVAAGQAAASAAAHAKVLAGASAGAGGGALATSGTVAGASVAATAAKPAFVLLTAFALGAGAGGGTLVALSAGSVFESKVAPAPRVPSAASATARRSASGREALRSLEPASVAAAFEGTPAERAAPPESHKAARVASSSRAPAKPHQASADVAKTRGGSEASSLPRTETLTAQQALLDRARSALARGDGDQALAALGEHARVHPGSALVEEREALFIKSLIAAGDVSTVRARAAAFAARYPHSLFLPSIRAALSKNP